MHIENIIKNSHKFSEKDFPVQMAIGQIVFDALKNNVSILPEEIVEWESLPCDERVEALSDCVSLLVSEIDRIKSLENARLTLDNIIEKNIGKDALAKIKSDSQEAYLILTSSIKQIVSEKCTEQRRNVLNNIVSTPFFMKHRVDFPRTAITQSPEPII